MKVLVCTNALSVMNGTIFHRLYQPFKDLSECGLEIEFCADFLSQQYTELLKYDVVVVSRTLTYNPNLHEQALAYWHNMPKSTRLIVDLDDYWNLPENHPNINHWRTHETSQCIIDTLRLASQVWTTNKELLKKIGKVNNKVKIIPNSIKPGEYKKNAAHVTRLGICVNNTHEMNLPLLASGLFDLDKNKYELHLLGADSSRKSNVQQFLNIDENKLRYKHYEWTKPINYHVNYENIDVMLCPLYANYFNKFRSELKLDEGAAYKFKVIASNYGPYHNKESAGVITTKKHFNDLNNLLFELETQSLPNVKNSWSSCQQLRLDNLLHLVYNHNGN
tara:strand:- start:19254 stop:20255 length:1002 start_codon:yes stop_codon:yes gene_type:complete